MVTIDGVMIRRLPDTEFTKITDENGNEVFRAALPEKDGFAPFVLISSEDINFDSIPITARQMRNFTRQDIREFMDGWIPNVVKQIQDGLKAHSLEGDVKVDRRVGNAVTVLVEFENGYGYQKNILDIRNGRFVYVAGFWKSIDDKKTIKACVDSVRLATE